MLLCPRCGVKNNNHHCWKGEDYCETQLPILPGAFEIFHIIAVGCRYSVYTGMVEIE